MATALATAPAALGDPPPAPGDPPAAVAITDVRVGWEGQFKVGHWAPLRVGLQAGAEAVTCQVRWKTVDGEGLPLESLSEPVELGPGQRRVWEGAFRAGRLDQPLHVQLLVRGKVVQGRSLSTAGGALSSQTRLVVVLGGDVDLGDVLSARQTRTRQPVQLVRVADATSLPIHALAYQGIDLLVLAADPPALAGLAEARQEALDRWLHLGGRLLLYGARHGDQVWGAGQPLARWIPGRYTGTLPQRDTSGLETYLGAEEPLDRYRPPGELVFQVPLAHVQDPEGRVVIWEGFGENRRAILIQAAAGLGRVVFVGYDLDQFPFTEWKGTERLLARLLDLVWEPVEMASQPSSGQITHVGYSDLIGQLRAALERFPGVRLVPFSLVALLVGIYVALIGPIDYLFLRRWGHPSWTWLTSVVVVAVFCLTAYLLHGLWKGRELRLNQVDLVDWDAESGYWRSTTWMHLYSPRSAKYDLQLERAAGLTEVLPEVYGEIVTWQGLPGSGFGGMDTPHIRMAVREGYRLDLQQLPSRTTGRLEGFPILVASSRSLLGQMWGRGTAEGAAALAANVDGQLRGWVQNPWPVALQRCWLVYDRWLYERSALAAGERWTISAGEVPKSLELVLTERQVIGGKDVGTPWDRQGTDVARIMDMMMFHAASGGTIYTRLTHRYQDAVDLSGHLQLGRAILVGYGEQPATGLKRQPGPAPLAPDRRWSIYRLVLPVSGTYGGSGEVSAGD